MKLDENRWNSSSSGATRPEIYGETRDSLLESLPASTLGAPTVQGPHLQVTVFVSRDDHVGLRQVNHGRDLLFLLFEDFDALQSLRVEDADRVVHRGRVEHQALRGDGHDGRRVLLTRP